jgi:hypothetical protein
MRRAAPPLILTLKRSGIDRAVPLSSLFFHDVAARSGPSSTETKIAPDENLALSFDPCTAPPSVDDLRFLRQAGNAGSAGLPRRTERKTKAWRMRVDADVRGKAPSTSPKRTRPWWPEFLSKILRDSHFVRTEIPLKISRRWHTACLLRHTWSRGRMGAGSGFGEWQNSYSNPKRSRGSVVLPGFARPLVGGWAFRGPAMLASRVPRDGGVGIQLVDDEERT